MYSRYVLISKGPSAIFHHIDKIAYNATTQSTSDRMIPIERDYKSILRPRTGYDVELGKKYFELAAKAYYENEDDLMKYLKLAADCGHVEAQRGLGGKYYALDEPSMYKEAFKYFKLAADQGCPIAWKNLGSLYYQGLGTKVNRKKSFQCYERSSNGGFDIGQYRLGWCYLRGRGVQKNHGLAFHYFNLSALQGYQEAVYAVGKCYLIGTGVKVDVSEAYKYFERASPDDYKYENANKDIEDAVNHYGSQARLQRRRTKHVYKSSKKRISWLI